MDAPQPKRDLGKQFFLDPGVESMEGVLAQAAGAEEKEAAAGAGGGGGGSRPREKPYPRQA